MVRTKYYPHPVEKINISAEANDDRGTMSDLTLKISKASLEFEGRPFYFRGSFSNFDDIRYDIAAKGNLDIGRIYQVFSRKDLGITGAIRANVSFRGKQSDAIAGRYEQLNNTGTLDIKNLRLRHEYFPKPFVISQGRFHFDRDKMWFDQFIARYGSTDLQLDGFLQNAINYALGGSKTLSGNFNLNARYINIDEFAAYSSVNGSSATEKDSTVDATARGVVLIPTNLNLILKAEAEKINYDGIVLDHFNGGVNISGGGIELTQTGFNLIGTQVNMSGKYNSTSPVRAVFNYHLQAKDFDIHRAYEEIKMFRELASSAQHAQGIISLDYSLSGKLNEDMRPIYPSLTGGGTLSVRNVKFNGWKLFNTVSSKTDKSGLKDPDLSKIDVKSTIRNNLITIEKMRFKTGGFRIRFEGQTSFDNKINFKMRIGLPPLGIIGIPLRITGTSDNPAIRLGNKDTDPLEETME
jgi:AsmA protein